MTWQEIESIGNASAHYQFTMCAYENAAETVYVEKTVPENQLGEMFINSLGNLLAYSDDKAAQTFFANLGVRW